jgi:hypothetical protein
VTLDTMPDFYASRVEFHGRPMSARALFEEKRRFVRRWPVRAYTPRLGSMQVECEPAPETCTVRTVFDFTAISPERGRRSDGVARLELELSFAGGRPAIVAETSRVLSRGGRARVSAAFEDDHEE